MEHSVTNANNQGAPARSSEHPSAERVASHARGMTQQLSTVLPDLDVAAAAQPAGRPVSTVDHVTKV